jgi:hypothetical protein
MILGCDVLTGLGIKIDFGNNILEWDSIVIPMKDTGENIEEAFALHKPKAVVQASDRLKSILDAKYEKADLEEVSKEAVHLKESQQQQLHALLKEFPKLFDSSLGKWCMGGLKVEVDRLVEAGVLQKVNCSEWVAPTFIIPKKDGSVRFISNFQELNKWIKWKPYPMYLRSKICY